MTDEPDRPLRFLKIQDVAEIMATSDSQIYALLRTGELRGIQIGGRKQWRIERVELERWIADRYEYTKQNLSNLPASLDDETD